MRSAELDAWLPNPAIRMQHRRTADADAAAVWQAATALRMDQTRTIGRLVQWRIPGTRGETGFRDLLASPPFAVLAEGEHWSISGLCGRIWTTALDYPQIDATTFRGWAQPGTVRVLLAHWVQADEDGHTSTITSEARVQPVDRRAHWALRSLWLAVGPFECLVGAEPLTQVVRTAEAARRR